MVSEREYADAFYMGQALLQSGASVDDLLTELKRAGLNQSESIRALFQLGVAEPHGAKRLVHFSRAWSASRARNEQLHDEIFHELFPEADEPS